MATVTILRNTQKKLQNGNNPIQMRITHERIRKYITIGMNGKGLNGNDKTFDDIAGRFTNLESNYKAKNSILANKLNDAERILQRFELDKIPFSFELFEREFIVKSKKNSLIHFLILRLKG